ncbi:LytTR family DNA-binding domain-containing protein [Cesiribacter sp. SM1]|uniref:LytR/AlgR family response regulator transcription factor n=1 Tax=Cesiribacter sp. SM1 TaxID=2861196 RepID=UPI001CD5F4A1|nr:LytTR family DNA-binding domain-containing protein [Cesiribacter sp. SM1]
MRCIAVDDEPLALALIKSYIERVPFLQLIGTYDSAYEALEVVQQQDIELVFLDINMPDLTGLQFIRSLSKPPAIIFTTAYQQYAVEGFELDAVDYLLKPYAFERFLKAVNKANRQTARPAAKPAAQPIAPAPATAAPAAPQPSAENSEEFIFIKVEHNILKLNLKEVFYIEAFKDYVKIHTNEARAVLTIKSMKAMEEMLEGKGFIRIHRSYIVSIEKIESMRNNRVMVKGKSFPVGENYKELFYEKVVKGKI